MSNIPIPPSPSPSRSRPGYGGYHGPRGGTFYGSGAANSNGLRGDSWRAEPSYRPRDPNADHYEPEYDNDRSRLTWGGVSYPQSQAYDPADPWPRRDVMAESMLEPSDSWRNDHAPDQEVDASERFAEDRARMPPPRDDFAYPYDGDSYRDVFQRIASLLPIFISQALPRWCFAATSFPLFVFHPFLSRALEIAATLSGPLSLIRAVVCRLAPVWRGFPD
ncbi:hypothetical protein BC834DRAFT_975303 [Gloeopeniophorella convolvens]|nr:hypothetical protein BC834DRAFT_975303 [Gloeopeniophorella convolvens]